MNCRKISFLILGPTVALLFLAACSRQTTTQEPTAPVQVTTPAVESTTVTSVVPTNTPMPTTPTPVPPTATSPPPTVPAPATDIDLSWLPGTLVLSTRNPMSSQPPFPPSDSKIHLLSRSGIQEMKPPASEFDVSPDARRMVYWNEDHILEIMDLATSEVTILQSTEVETDQHEGDLQWSPDGNDIAFTADKDLWIVDTTDQARILSEGTYARYGAGFHGGICNFAWSSDGNSVFYDDFDPPQVLRIWQTCHPQNRFLGSVDVASGETRTLASDAAVIQHPPEGGKVWLSTANGETELKYKYAWLDARSGEIEVVDIPDTTFGSDQPAAAFSPDGDFLATVEFEDSDADTGSAIAVRDVRTDEETRRIDFREDHGLSRLVVWSPDGQYLAFFEVEPAYRLGVVSLEEGAKPVYLLSWEEPRSPTYMRWLNSR